MTILALLEVCITNDIRLRYCYLTAEIQIYYMKLLIGVCCFNPLLKNTTGGIVNKTIIISLIICLLLLNTLFDLIIRIQIQHSSEVMNDYFITLLHSFVVKYMLMTCITSYSIPKYLVQVGSTG